MKFTKWIDQFRQKSHHPLSGWFMHYASGNHKLHKMITDNRLKLEELSQLQVPKILHLSSHYIRNDWQSSLEFKLNRIEKMEDD